MRPENLCYSSWAAQKILLLHRPRPFQGKGYGLLQGLSFIFWREALSLTHWGHTLFGRTDCMNTRTSGGCCRGWLAQSPGSFCRPLYQSPQAKHFAFSSPLNFLFPSCFMADQRQLQIHCHFLHGTLSVICSNLGWEGERGLEEEGAHCVLWSREYERSDSVAVSRARPNTLAAFSSPIS